MPQTGLLSSGELATVRQSWWRIQQAGGVTYVDDAVYGEGHGAANAVAAWFNTAASMENIGIRRAEAMVQRYAHYGQLATQGRRLGIRIWIVTGHPGTIQIDALDTVPPDVALAAMIEGQMLEIAAGLEGTTIAEPPPLATLEQEVEAKSPAPLDPIQEKLLELAAEAARHVGRDLYNWAKSLINDAESINSVGHMSIDHRDRLICYLDNVDDQAFVYLNGKLLSARSLGEKGFWDTAEPLPRGNHLLTLVAKNSGWWGWSYRCLLGRASDYLPQGPKKPAVRLQDGQDWPGDGPRQFTRLFFMRIYSY